MKAILKKATPTPEHSFNIHKDIGYEMLSSWHYHPICQLNTSFDYEKFERILFNLLSNAFKFTPGGGHIRVKLSEVYRPEINRQYLKIEIVDTGIGIAKDKQEKIFERFFQNDIPGSMVNQGSGIGLSITKEFIKLHDGEMTVDSEPGQGSSFTVMLPVSIIQISDHQPECDLSEVIIESGKITETLPQAAVLPPEIVIVNRKKSTILMVEDNEDFRFYIKDNLKNYYNIIEAINGKEGWQKALAYHPDLVVSDISMPEMDGIELCKKLKADSRTSHIPIILLTAIVDEEKQLEGFGTGATDYIIKPFNFEILLSKIRTFIAQQGSMRKTYQKQVDVKVTDVSVLSSSADERFILKALQYIEKHIANANLSVEDLSSEMCLSRGSLYKKLLTLTGKTPLEFIRHIRIERAAQLLKSSNYNISEIAYEVGFNNPKYFAKYFKEEYGLLPSAYVEKKPEELVKNHYDSLK